MKYIIIFIIIAFSIPESAKSDQLNNAIINKAPYRVETILKSGFSPNVAGPNGNTALINASLIGDAKIVHLLLKYGANPNIRNIAKITPLHIAARTGNIEIIELLLRAKAEINIQDFRGYTPLMRAISNKHQAASRSLILLGADVMVRNNDNKTSFDYAILNGQIDILNILLRKLKYKNITYLKSLYITYNSVRPSSDILDARIAEIEDKRMQKINAIRVTAEDVKKYYNIKYIPNYPCVNQELKNINIASEVCIKKHNKNITKYNPKQKERFDIKKINPIAGIKTGPLILRPTIPKIISPNIRNSEYNRTKYRKKVSDKPADIIAHKPLNNKKNIPEILVKKKEYSNHNDYLFAISAIKKERLDDPIKVQYYNINMKIIDNYSKVSSVRTKEWNINQDNIPESIIDLDTMGYNPLFNRKFKRSIENKPSTISKKIDKKHVYIQLATLANPSNIASIKIKAKKFGTISEKIIYLKGKKHSKIILGPISSIEEAKELQKRSDFIKLFGQKTILRKNR